MFPLLILSPTASLNPRSSTAGELFPCTIILNLSVTLRPALIARHLDKSTCDRTRWSSLYRFHFTFTTSLTSTYLELESCPILLSSSFSVLPHRAHLPRRSQTESIFPSKASQTSPAQPKPLNLFYLLPSDTKEDLLSVLRLLHLKFYLTVRTCPASARLRASHPTKHYKPPLLDLNLSTSQPQLKPSTLFNLLLLTT